MVPETLKIFAQNNDLVIAFVCAAIFIASALFLWMINRRQQQQQQQQQRQTTARHQSSLSASATAANSLSTASTAPLKTLKKKKPKKQANGKKNSDSTEESTVSEDVSSSESPRSAASERKLSRSHVEFVISPNDVITTVAAPLKKRKQPPKTAAVTATTAAAAAAPFDKIKPILVNKSEKSEINLPIGDPVLNSFQEIVPKDDFELHRSRSLEKKSNSSRKEYVHRIKQMKSIGVQSGGHASAPVASDTKKKPSSDLLQQINKSQTLNVNLLIQLIQDSDITKFEIQTLIDMLLNKQQDTPDTNEDWSQGKSDPVQKLKKQLAEKQRQLDEEQEANVALTNKIRDIRTELNGEKAHTTKLVREHEETLAAKKQEYLNRTNLCQNRIAELQSKLNESHENQTVLQQKIKSYENMMADESKRSQSNLAAINAKIKETNDLKRELDAIRESEVQKQEMLRKQVSLLENQLHHYRNEADKVPEFTKKLDELIMIRSDLEQRIAELLMSDREKSEALKQSNCELSFMKQIQEDSDKIITHLKNENVQLLETEKLKSKEIVNLENFLMTMNKKLENAIIASNETEVLKNEIAVLKTKLDETTATNQQMLKSKTCEIEFLQKKLTEQEKEFESRTVSTKNAAELKTNEIESLRIELDAKTNTVDGQRKQLACVRQEFDELRETMTENEKRFANRVAELERRLKERETATNEKTDADRELIDSLRTQVSRFITEMQAADGNGTETMTNGDTANENGSDSVPDADADTKLDQLQKKFDSLNSFLSFTRNQLEIQAQKNVNLKKQNYKLFETMAKRQQCERCKIAEQEQKNVEESIKALVTKMFPSAIDSLPAKTPDQTFDDWLQTAEFSLKKHLIVTQSNGVSDKTAAVAAAAAAATNGQLTNIEPIGRSVNGENGNTEAEHN